MNAKTWLTRAYGLPLIILLAVVVMLIDRNFVRPQPFQRADSALQVNDWVYVPNEVNKGFEDIAGRPGKILSLDSSAAKVGYDAEANTNWKEPATKPIPLAILKRCPPAQDGIIDDFAGVIRIWKGSGSEPLEAQNIHHGKLGDSVIVELKDFDRWLFMQFDFGRLTEELNTIPAQVETEVRGAIQARRSIELLEGVKRVNDKLRSEELRGELFVHTDADIKKDKLKELLELIDNSPVLSSIREKIKDQLQEGVPVDQQIRAVEQRFLPIRVWASTVTENKFKQLTMSLNGVVVAGVNPLTPYNAAEVTHDRRPSFPDDLYQWARFELKRNEIDSNGSESASALIRQNQAAWFQLVGKPSFELPCNVTLTLPEGLQLPSKVTTETKDPECRFFLVGIELWKFTATVVLFAIFLLFLLWLARTTNILRDSSGRVRADGIEPVSLGRTQMAFWFLLTSGAYTFLWVTTGNNDTINNTCLILMGIGSGTALGAALIESNDARFLIAAPLSQPCGRIKADIASAIVVRLRGLFDLFGECDESLQKQFIALLQQLKHVETGGTEGAGAAIDGLLTAACQDWKIKDEEMPEVFEGRSDEAIMAFARRLKEGAELESAKDPRSARRSAEIKTLAGELELLGLQSSEFKRLADTAWKRLFADWLSEGNTNKYSFHRFQMLVWTVLLGFIFVAKVLADRAMPEFNATTLSLLGISAGTYLGFKFPAVRKDEAARSGAAGQG